MTLTFTINTPSGDETETIDLKPGSTVDFVRADGKAYSVSVDESPDSSSLKSILVETT